MKSARGLRTEPQPQIPALTCGHIKPVLPPTPANWFTQPTQWTSKTLPGQLSIQEKFQGGKNSSLGMKQALFHQLSGRTPAFVWRRSEDRKKVRWNPCYFLTSQGEAGGGQRLRWPGSSALLLRVALHWSQLSSPGAPLLLILTQTDVQEVTVECREQCVTSYQKNKAQKTLAFLKAVKATRRDEDRKYNLIGNLQPRLQKKWNNVIPRHSRESLIKE